MDYDDKDYSEPEERTLSFDEGGFYYYRTDDLGLLTKVYVDESEL